MPSDSIDLDDNRTARLVGIGLLATIISGALAATMVGDIDVNLTGDVAATAEAMRGKELAVRARSYLGLANFAIEALVLAGLFALLVRSGPLLAAWSLIVSLGAVALNLVGSLTVMNAAELGTAGSPPIAELQVLTDYTSFHLALVLGSVGKAGFFMLFLRSSILPPIIAGWGVFASMLVSVVIVARDFVPAFGNDVVTAGFLLANLVAILSAGLYLALKGASRTA